MNEITKIHLGRTAFTVDVDAHKELRRYLEAIKKHVGAKHKEVLEEVELRMAELLTEKGITADKVVIAKDVAYLKEQLGSPSDFEDDEDVTEHVKSPAADEPTRRLFRDPRDQILGGVASGLGTYFGIDAWVFRAVFVALCFAGGSGFLIYLLLWLLIPKAKSNSDFLQMKGKPVTVDALTDFVESQEFSRDAKRIGNRAGQALSEMFQLLGRIARYAVGTILTAVSLVSIIWTLILGVYVLTNPEKLFGGDRIFPVGNQETALFILVMVVLLSALALLLSSGIAFFRQKWPLPLWTSAALGAIFIVGSAVSVGLGAEAGQRIHDRYQAAHRTETRQLDDFKELEISGDEAMVKYEYARTPSVDIRTIGAIDNQAVKTDVRDDKLALDVTGARRKSCGWLCINTQDIVVTVRAPQLDQITVHENVVFRSDEELHQDKLTLISSDSADVSLSHVYPKNVYMSVAGYDDMSVGVGPKLFWQEATYRLELSDITNGFARDRIWHHQNQGYTVARTDDFTLDTKLRCERHHPLVSLWEAPGKLTINDQQIIPDGLQGRKPNGDLRDVNCVSLR